MNTKNLNSCDYVKEAEEVMLTFKSSNPFKIVTTTKLRNLLAMISDIYNDVMTPGSTVGDNKHLNKDIVDRIRYLKVKFIYESGREESVRTFVDRANIINYLDDLIEEMTKDNFIRFSRYMEALVAYRKYHFIGDK